MREIYQNCMRLSRLPRRVGMVLLLEVARGIAALWVFLFHMKGYFKESSEFMYLISEYGYFGVPMFFVISGFVITYSAESTLKYSLSPFSFLKKRFLRIYPVFWISIILILLLPYLIESISMLKSGSYVAPYNLLSHYTLSEWFNFVALSKVFFADSVKLHGQFDAINAVYWTIAIEFQFYLVIFLSLFFKSYYKHVIAFISVLAIINMVVPFNVNYGLFIHFWPSFSVGILLAYLFKAKFVVLTLIPKLYNIKFAMASLFLFILAPVIFLSDKPSHFVFAVLFGCLLWCISPLEKELHRIRSNGKRLSFYILEAGIALGAMSYSVYLLHLKLHALPAMFVRQAIDESNVLYVLTTILVTLLICYPFYLYVERPFMSKKYVKTYKDPYGAQDTNNASTKKSVETD